MLNQTPSLQAKYQESIIGSITSDIVWPNLQPGWVFTELGAIRAPIEQITYQYDAQISPISIKAGQPTWITILEADPSTTNLLSPSIHLQWFWARGDSSDLDTLGNAFLRGGPINEYQDVGWRKPVDRDDFQFAFSLIGDTQSNQDIIIYEQPLVYDILPDGTTQPSKGNVSEIGLEFAGEKADGFILDEDATITGIRWYGTYGTQPIESIPSISNSAKDFLFRFYSTELPTQPVFIDDAVGIVNAGQGKDTITFSITLPESITEEVTFDVFTIDASAISTSNLKDSQDYEPISKNTISFLPGETTQDISVEIYEELAINHGDAPLNHKNFEIFAKDFAYRKPTIKEDIDLDFMGGNAVYDDFGYRVDQVFSDPALETGFNAVGFTSNEEFYLILSDPNQSFIKETENRTDEILEKIRASLGPQSKWGSRDSSIYDSATTKINELNNQNIPWTYAKGTIIDLGKQPILALTGTEEVADILSDANPNGVGFNQYIAKREELKEWLKNVSSINENNRVKPHLIGHSLGGALTQWLAADYPGDVSEVVTFNAPGISASVQDANGAYLGTEHISGTIEKTTHYITTSDVVSLAGEKYIPGKYVISDYQSGINIVGTHVLPVIADYIQFADDLEKQPKTRPSDISREYFESIDSLENPLFSHLPDPDYFLFLLVVATVGDALGPKLSKPLLGSTLAAKLSYRQIVEESRKGLGNEIGSDITIGDIPLILNEISSGGVLPPVLEAAYLAANQWGDEVWSVIQEWGPKAFSTAIQWNPLVWNNSLSWDISFWNDMRSWTDNEWEDSLNWTLDKWDRAKYLIDELVSSFLGTIGELLDALTPSLLEQFGADKLKELFSDANDDGILDSSQLNVASVITSNDNLLEFYTLASPDNTKILDVSTISSNGSIGFPEVDNVSFPIDPIEFSIVDLDQNEKIVVDLLLKGDLNDSSFNTYWKYGPEPDIPEDHWYEFEYDGQTGAKFIDSDGDLKADKVELHFIDGQRGDGDLVANGIIVDPGALGIKNSNDANITDDVGIVTEDSNQNLIIVTGQVLVTDADANEAFVIAKTVDGKYGNFDITDDGSWTYSAVNTQKVIQELGEGESLIETFSVSSLDESANGQVTITIIGTNDLAQVTDNFQTVLEDSDPTTLTVSSQVSVTDIDKDQSFVEPNDITGIYGQFSVDANGNWLYSADNTQSAIQALSFDQQITETFTVNSQDGTGSGTVTITITGTNDQPIISEAISVDITEDDDIFYLDLLNGATDPDANDILTVTNLTLVSGDPSGVSIDYNSLVIDPNAYNSHAVGEDEVITYNYNVVDGNGGGVAQTATITVNGVNDNPEVSSSVEDQKISAYSSYRFTLLENTFTDVDGDYLSLTATLADGSSLPDWLNFDPNTGTFSGFPTSNDVSNLVVEVTAKDGNGGIISETFNLKVELPLNTTTNIINSSFLKPLLIGTKANDQINGSDKGDWILGNKGDDNLFGNGGFDRVLGNKGNDFMDGGDGKDHLFGHSGEDLLIGGQGRDALFGGADNDILDGGNGDDMLVGGRGDDLLIGGEGDDRLTGGKGSDLFVLSLDNGRDIVLDYKDGIDSFGITDGITFSDLTVDNDKYGNALIQFNGSTIAKVLGASADHIGAEDFSVL